MMKKSHRVYESFSSDFHMPRPTTLDRTLQQIPCSVGLSRVVLTKLREVGEKMDERDKYCLLLWDEMKLATHIQYDRKSDTLVGFEDWGYRRTHHIADHAIVLMIRSIRAGWTLPVYYGFCKSLTKTPDLKRCIKDITGVIEKSGFSIVATVCDQAAANRKTVNDLIRESNMKRRARNEPERELTMIKVY